MTPPNGASMADAARTRENEGPCICDDCCGSDTKPCGVKRLLECEAAAASEAADDAIKARKERDL